MSEYKLKWYIMTTLSMILLHIWLILIIPISFIQGMFIGAFDNVMQYIGQYKSMILDANTKKFKYRIMDLEKQLKEKGE